MVTVLLSIMSGQSKKILLNQGMSLCLVHRDGYNKVGCLMLKRKDEELADDV
jgi:hypothetical protein